jgi:hypothetical protein
MKRKVFYKIVIPLLVFWFSETYSQVNNDSCYTATDLGVVGLFFHDNGCFDGTINNDTFLVSSNANSAIEFPYMGMTGCLGYSSFNNTPTNDIWYKFKTSAFQIKVSYYFPNPIDSLHLNVWIGSNCNNLFPSGCYTFDLLGGGTNNVTTFSGTSNPNDYVYLQFSGNAPGKFGTFAFCLTGEWISAVTYYGIADIITNLNNTQNNNDIKISPNPFDDYSNLTFTNPKNEKHTLTIFNTTGQIVQQKDNIISGEIKIERENLVSGIYFFQLRSVSNVVVTGKLVVE